MEEQTTAGTSGAAMPTSVLEFKGPFHFSHLEYLNLKGKSGIYIWGFMFNISNGKIMDIVDFADLKSIPNFNDCILDGKPFGYKNEKWIFIPYYVGKAESISIADRLKQHQKVRNYTSAKKYTRMSMDYYKLFFKYPDFKPNTGNRNGKRCNEIDNLIWPNNGQNSNKITYQNCYKILNKLYTLNILKKYKSNKKTQNYDYPITDYNVIPDTLNEVVDCKKNFWFCYAELDEKGENELKEYKSTLKKGCRSEFLKNPEAQTFYSLKGKTISETLPYRKNGFGHTITCNSSGTKMSPCIEIFENISGVIPPNPTGNFLGY